MKVRPSGSSMLGSYPMGADPASLCTRGRTLKMLPTSNRAEAPRSHGARETIGRYWPTLANTVRSKVATGEKCKVSPASVSTEVALRQLAPMRAPIPLFDQPACACTWCRGWPPV